MRSIPIIDVAVTQDEAATIKAVENACRDIGFMYVVNHGIPPETVATIRSAVIAYFSRPLEDKLRDRITRDN